MGKSTAQAIADLATKVSGEQVMQPNGTTTVLDAVLDALTGNEVPYSSFATVADAIEAAAEAYPSGGGGVTLGPLGDTFFSDDTPAIGDEVSAQPLINTVKIGDSTVSTVSGDGFQPWIPFAAGVTIESGSWSNVTPAAYVCAVDSDEGTYSSVTPWDGEVNVSEDGVLSFVLPELADGTVLVFTTAV